MKKRIIILATLVLFVVRGLFRQADRTSLRDLLRSARTRAGARVAPVPSGAARPESMWTITPQSRTTSSRGVDRRRRHHQALAGAGHRQEDR